VGRSSLRARYKIWRENKKRFPVIWLTYSGRVRDDVDALYATKGGADFFNDDYISTLTTTIEQLEGRELKLLGLSVTISIFMVLCVISSDASISIFGVPIKNAPGVKELLLVLAATITLLAFMLQQAKQLRVTVLDKLVALRTQAEFAHFAKLATKAHYDLSIYVARQFDKWIFPTLSTKLTSFLTGLLLTLVFVSFLGFNLSIWIYVFWELLHAPTLGAWSYAALLYAGAAFLCVLLWWLRATLPFPYRDNRKLLRLAQLRETDPAAFEALWNEVYGRK
jgi:hypothetical protein